MIPDLGEILKNNDNISGLPVYKNRYLCHFVNRFLQTSYFCFFFFSHFMFSCLFLQTLEEKEKRNAQLLEKLTKDNGNLQRRIEELSGIQWYRPERSISECSTSTNSTNSASESGECRIFILTYLILVILSVILYGGKNSFYNGPFSVQTK